MNEIKMRLAMLIATGITPAQIKTTLELSDYQFRTYSKIPAVIDYANKYRETLAKEDVDKIKDFQMESLRRIYASINRLADLDKLSEQFMKDFITQVNRTRGLEKISEDVSETKRITSGGLLRITEKANRKMLGMPKEVQQMVQEPLPLPEVKKDRPVWEEDDYEVPGETIEESVERSVEYKDDSEED